MKHTIKIDYRCVVDEADAKLPKLEIDYYSPKKRRSAPRMFAGHISVRLDDFCGESLGENMALYTPLVRYDILEDFISDRYEGNILNYMDAAVKFAVDRTIAQIYDKALLRERAEKYYRRTPRKLIKTFDDGRNT